MSDGYLFLKILIRILNTLEVITSLKRIKTFVFMLHNSIVSPFIIEVNADISCLSKATSKSCSAYLTNEIK